MSDSAPAANAKPSLLTVVLLPSIHNTNHEYIRRDIYEVCYQRLDSSAADGLYVDHCVCYQAVVLTPMSRQKNMIDEGHKEYEVRHPVRDVHYNALMAQYRAYP